MSLNSIEAAGTSSRRLGIVLNPLRHLVFSTIRPYVAALLAENGRLRGELQDLEAELQRTRARTIDLEALSHRLAALEDRAR